MCTYSANLESALIVQDYVNVYVDGNCIMLSDLKRQS